MTPIKDFIREVNVRRESLRELSSTIIWTDEFIKGGYYHAIPGSLSHWSEIHEWCNHHIGCDNYAWNGSNFWFENQKDCVLFKLMWA